MVDPKLVMSISRSGIGSITSAPANAWSNDPSNLYIEGFMVQKSLFEITKEAGPTKPVKPILLHVAL